MPQSSAYPKITINPIATAEAFGFMGKLPRHTTRIDAGAGKRFVARATLLRYNRKGFLEPGMSIYCSGYITMPVASLG